MKDLNIYLKYLLDAIKQIEFYTKNMNFNKFDNDQKTIDACLMQLEHIWETTKNIRKNYPDFDQLPKREMSWLRDFIAHDYLWIDNEIIRDTIKIDLIVVKRIINTILNIK